MGCTQEVALLSVKTCELELGENSNSTSIPANVTPNVIRSNEIASRSITIL